MQAECRPKEPTTQGSKAGKQPADTEQRDTALVRTPTQSTRYCTQRSSGTAPWPHVAQWAAFPSRASTRVPIPAPTTKAHGASEAQPADARAQSAAAQDTRGAGGAGGTHPPCPPGSPTCLRIALPPAAAAGVVATRQAPSPPAGPSPGTHAHAPSCGTYGAFSATRRGRGGRPHPSTEKPGPHVHMGTRFARPHVSANLHMDMHARPHTPTRPPGRTRTATPIDGRHATIPHHGPHTHLPPKVVKAAPQGPPREVGVCGRDRAGRGAGGGPGRHTAVGGSRASAVGPGVPRCRHLRSSSYCCCRCFGRR
jgi:hypothetical protein